ncbi:class I SAM-dependent methyltransferase [Cohnella lupini]|uniref:Methyltransferase family protein n=1 Tax=Cohnella lupini TaxID=1294267 RepID=A0A3D9IVF9_9BACL|nr:class I SAM-dependent methyltransferase [Cohnella lupini]RED65607.1 methyltransferase family protein [Cohnella lupini]
MMMVNKSKPQAYPQAGVASTCRSYEEYRLMFGLTETDLERMGPVLDVAGGASSFTAHLNAMGFPAVAVDPFYAGETEEVIAMARKEIEVSSAKLAAMSDIYDWSFYGSPGNHRAMRERSLELFAEDFRKTEARKRYYSASLPSLPFENDAFGLILCSHFLFLYADSFDREFHQAAIKELFRVLRPGGELRIYPLINLKWERYPFISDILRELKDLAQEEYLPTALPFTPVPSPLLRLVKSDF